MKTITDEELKSLAEVLDFVEHEAEYLHDLGSLDAQPLADAAHALQSVIQREDYKPEVKIVEKIVEKETLTEQQIRDMVSAAERRGRESVNPLFKYCVFNSLHTNALYVTDNYETALAKAKSLSVSEGGISEGGYWYVYSIKQAYDKSYKLYVEGFYYDSKFIESSRGSREFLHFDYIRCICTRIIKI